MPEPEINSVNLSLVTAKTSTTQEQKSANKFTRTERLHFRNQKILTDLATGKSIQYVMDEYNLSQRRVYEIVEEARKESLEWYQNLPKGHMIQLFRNAVDKIFEKLQELENLIDSGEDKFDYTERYINTYANFVRLLADGPALVRTKEAVEQAEKFSNIHFNKQK